MNLLGNLNPSVDSDVKEKPQSLAEDLVADSTFQEQREKNEAEKADLFEDMEAMPANLGGKSSNLGFLPSEEVCGKDSMYLYKTIFSNS